MLIPDYELTLESPRCHPGSEHWFAYADFDANISPVLPYLNATLTGARYQPSVPALACHWEGYGISFLPHRIAISEFEDRDEACAVTKRVVALVNDTWNLRSHIQPRYDAPVQLQPLAIYRLLPRTNCGLCQAPTCFSFALRLVTGDSQWSACPPLHTEPWLDQREQILRMMSGDEA